MEEENKSDHAAQARALTDYIVQMQKIKDEIAKREKLKKADEAAERVMKARRAAESQRRILQTRPVKVLSTPETPVTTVTPRDPGTISQGDPEGAALQHNLHLWNIDPTRGNITTAQQARLAYDYNKALVENSANAGLLVANPISFAGMTGGGYLGNYVGEILKNNYGVNWAPEAGALVGGFLGGAGQGAFNAGRQGWNWVNRNYVLPYRLSRAINNSTRNLLLPIKEFMSPISIPEGFMSHTGSISYPGRIDKDPESPVFGKFINREYGPGALVEKNGMYVSARPPHTNKSTGQDNADKLWWDLAGHNAGKDVYMTPKSGVHQTLDPNMGIFDASQPYYVTDPIPIDLVVHFKWSPLGSYIPSFRGRILNNKMPADKIFRGALENIRKSETVPTIDFNTARTVQEPVI